MNPRGERKTCPHALGFNPWLPVNETEDRLTGEGHTMFTNVHMHGVRGKKWLDLGLICHFNSGGD